MIRNASLALLATLASGPEAFAVASSALNADDRALLKTYAEATWRSIDRASKGVVLPSDGLWRSGDSWTMLAYTSPTDIASYIWSTIAAEGIGLIGREESGRRLSATLTAIGRLERSHGFFYNWYDPRTGDRLRQWPGGGPLRGFLSTVDNAWLAVSLMMAGRSHPELKTTAERLLAPMNFGFFYDPLDASDPVAHPGLLRGGFFPDGGGVFSDYHYGTLNTEPRIASYVGIALKQIPADHYYRMHRAAQESTAPMRTYKNVAVIESCQSYKGAKLLPSWDGTMFEALMVPLFIPEAAWGPKSWGLNHRLYAKAQIEYGLNDARLGYWGISASTDTRGGYHAFGVSALGLSPSAGRDDRGQPSRVVTPHASFLAMPYAPREAMDNLRKLAASFPACYTPYGFLDAVDVGTGSVSDGVLVLDQGMILAAIANALGQDALQLAFSDGAFETEIRPLIQAEQFEIAPSSILSRRPAMLARSSTVASPPAPPEPVSGARRIVAAMPDPTALPLGLDDRMGALGPQRTPARRRSGKPSDRRRPSA